MRVQWNRQIQLVKCRHTTHQDSPGYLCDHEHEIPFSQVVVRNGTARTPNRHLVPISSSASSRWKIAAKRQGERAPLTHSTISSKKKLIYKPSQAYEAQHILRNGTFDLPRMTHVLDNQRVWGTSAAVCPFFTQILFFLLLLGVFVGG